MAAASGALAVTECWRHPSGRRAASPHQAITTRGVIARTRIKL
ncbi:hypothetical protein [Streptomyces sp. NRRL F-2890]|nr:hypothetical protein [Streptomyces sp. NRRL F-2890]